MVIGILLFDGVDLLDSGGPYEVFLTASRLAVRDGDPAPFEVVTLGLDPEPVFAAQKRARAKPALAASVEWTLAHLNLFRPP